MVCYCWYNSIVGGRIHEIPETIMFPQALYHKLMINVNTVINLKWNYNNELLYEFVCFKWLLYCMLYASFAIYLAALIEQTQLNTCTKPIVLIRIQSTSSHEPNSNPPMDVDWIKSRLVGVHTRGESSRMLTRTPV